MTDKKHSLTFRCLRKLVGTIEKNWPEPQILSEIWRYKFPQVDAQRCFCVITTESKLTEAAWCAASFYIHSKPLRTKYRVMFAIDNECSDENRQKLSKTFPGCEITTKSDISKQLSLENFPYISELFTNHPLAFKLVTLGLINRDRDIVYIDNDVLSFNPTLELDKMIEEDRPAYNAESKNSYDQVIAGELLNSNIKLPDGLNSGLLVIPKKLIDLVWVNQLLSKARNSDVITPTWWWIEQTIIAGIFGTRPDAKPLPREQYVVSLQRQFALEPDVNYQQIEARHFISPVRPRFYRRGLPLILKKLKSLMPAPQVHYHGHAPSQSLAG